MGPGRGARHRGGAEARHLTAAGKETFNLGDQDMSAQMIRLRDAGVEVIVLYAVDRESANMLRSMDRIGYKPRSSRPGA